MPGPYELYLVRHGLADERGDSWPDDTKRPLTEEGISSLRKSARGLARAGVSFDVILTSPLVRTRQTADVIASAFDPRPPIVAVICWAAFTPIAWPRTISLRPERGSRDGTRRLYPDLQYRVHRKSSAW